MKLARDPFMKKLETDIQELKDIFPSFDLKDMEGNYKSTYEILKCLSSFYDQKICVSCEDAEQIADALLKESYIASVTEIQEAFKKLNNE